MKFNPEDPATPEAAAAAIMYFQWIALGTWGEALVRRDSQLDYWASAFWSDKTPASRMRDMGVEYAPAEWLQRGLNTAERQTWSRGLKLLIDVRLVRTVARNSRTSHLRLTPKGLAKYRRWCLRDGPQVGRQRVAELRAVLTTVTWARPIEKYLAVLERIDRQLVEV